MMKILISILVLVPCVAFAQDVPMPGGGLADIAPDLLDTFGVSSQWVALLGAVGYLVAQIVTMVDTQGMAAKGGAVGMLGKVLEIVAANHGKSKSAPVAKKT